MITIEDIRYYNEFKPSNYTDYFLFNLFERVRVDIYFRIEIFAISSEGQEVVFAPITQLTNDYIEDVSGFGLFKDLFVGDSVVITNSANNDQTVTILEKSSDSLIRTDTIFQNDGEEIGVKFVSSAHQTGVRFFSNFIENDEAINFDSKVTGQSIKFGTANADSSSTSEVQMNALGGKEWQIGRTAIEGGYATIRGQNGGGNDNEYIISYYTFVTPFFLAGQLSDLQSDINPSYLLNNNSLKHVFRIETSPDFADPNRLQTIDFDLSDGNCGGLGENFNGGLTNYSAVTTYERVSDSTAITALEIAEDTDVTIVLSNTADTPFVDYTVDSSNGTKVIVNFVFLPEVETLYQKTGAIMPENFKFDRGTNNAGVTTGTNGEAYGTDRQVIENLKVAFDSSSQLTITFRCNLGSALKTFLEGITSPKYLLTVNVQDQSIADNNDSDRVQLDADQQTFYIDYINDSVSYTNAFIEHIDNDKDDSQRSNQFLVEDTIVASTEISFDKQWDETINNFKVEIIAKNGSEVSVLETFNYDMSGATLIGGSQFVDFTQQRGYQLNSSELRYNIKILRRTDLDSGSVDVYQVVYPFMCRWDDYTALAGLNADFFDTAETNNGLNNEWARIDSESGWDLYYRITTTVENGDTQYDIEDDFQFYIGDYNQNTNWINNTIKFYDPDSATELVSGGNKFVYLDKNTQVEASFEHMGTIAAPFDFEIHLKIYQESLPTERWSLSNIYNRESSSNPLKSLLSTGLVDTNLVSSTITGKCLIDYTKLPSGKFSYELSAKVNSYNITITYKQFEDDQAFEFEDGDIYEFD